MQSSVKYSAVCAKVRTMYGNKITQSDYNELIQTANINRFVEKLKSLEGYKLALKDIDEHIVHRGQVENALKLQLYAENEKIYKLIAKSKRSYFNQFVKRAEIDQILNCVRLLLQDNTPDFILMVPHYLTKISNLPYKRMSDAKTYDELLNVMKDTEYYDVLNNFKNKDLAKHLQLMETALIFSHFKGLKEHIKDIPDKVRGIANEVLGVQIDFINISLIIRLRKYFNMPKEVIKLQLLPIRYKIKDKDIDALCNINSLEEALEYLKTTNYKSLISKINTENTNEFLSELLYNLCKKIISSGQNNIMVPLAYLHLKSIEITNLISITEGIRYNAGADKIKKLLIGVN